MYTVVRTEEEINRIMDWAYDGVENGSKYSGMSYEEGIVTILDWLAGLTDDDPIGE